MTLNHSWRDLEFSLLLQDTVLQMIDLQVLVGSVEFADQMCVPYVLDSYTCSYQNRSTLLPIRVYLYHLRLVSMEIAV